jgi:hypothetical protein
MTRGGVGVALPTWAALGWSCVSGCVSGPVPPDPSLDSIPSMVCPPLEFPDAAPPAPVRPSPAPVRASPGRGGASTNLCGTWLCQTNAASLGDNLFFHEVDASGLYLNREGIRYESFTGPDGDPMTLSVQGYELRGTRGTGPDQWLFLRENLIGATMVLSRGRDRYEVRISDVGQTRFWVAPELECAPTYTFEYRKMPSNGSPEVGPFTPLCTALDMSSEWNRPGITQTLAVVFAGDQYDPVAKTVTTPGPGDWFNVACAGSALAKMLLLRHAEAGQTWPYLTTFDQRQAMLKMITDDICGTGYSFTMDGEPVFYADVNEWHPLDFAGSLPRHAEIEALWDQDGAVCLNWPRRYAEDPDILRAVERECGQRPARRSCGATWRDWPQLGASAGAYGISVNP